MLSPLSQLDDEFNFPPSTVSLFKLLMQVVFVGHFFACLWMFVTVANDVGTPLADIPGPNWWRTMHMDPENPVEIYVASLYVRQQ